MAPPIGRIYHKNYEIAGNKFTIQVSYQGNIPAGRLAQEMDTWYYTLLVNDTTLEIGQWRDLRDSHPSNEEVCDSLAQFWYDSKKIKDAQDLGEKNLENGLTEIINQCKFFLDTYLMQEGYDYDIVMSLLTEEGGWTVIIQPNIPKLVDNRLFVFDHKATDPSGEVAFHSYVLDRSIRIQLPW
jgi:hypothetical protein